MRLIIVLLLVPGISGLMITEIHPAPNELVEFIEVWVDKPNATLTLTDNYVSSQINLSLNHTGLIILTEDQTRFSGCPVIETTIGNGLANSGDSIIIELANETDNHTYDTAEKGMSLHRCLNCSEFIKGPPSPCELETLEHESCTPPVIDAHPLQEDRLNYAIRSREAYEYWIEDGRGRIVRERASSSSDANKRYTPKARSEEHVFVIVAKNTCGEDRFVVGMIFDEYVCEPEEDDIIESITEEIATYICRPHIEQAAMLEERYRDVFTRFYTRAQKPNETYVFRTKLRENVSVAACIAREVMVQEDIAVLFNDSELIDGDPLIIAFENETVIDARWAHKPEFIGSYVSAHTIETDVEPQEPEITREPSFEQPLTQAPLSYRSRHLVNDIRTHPTIQRSAPWIVPVGFGLIGLIFALPRSKVRIEQ